jgi:hypothetical protein
MDRIVLSLILWFLHNKDGNKSATSNTCLTVASSIEVDKVHDELSGV